MTFRIDVPPGTRFGRLEVLHRALNTSNGKVRLKCRCDCGVEKIIAAEALRKRGQQSCGCLRNEKSGRRATATFKTHGEAARLTPEYSAWQSMKKRCNNPKGPKWDHYGGRGITVCDRWAHSYEAFLADVGRRPSKRHSLDRIDVNGNYEPGNVRWADDKTQRHNRRDSVVA